MRVMRNYVHMKNAQRKGKHMNVQRKFLTVVSACAIAMMTLTLSACGRTVDLSKYISVSYSGYNGYATAEANFDAISFASDNAGRIEVKGTGSKDKNQIAQTAFNDVHLTLDKADSISNGDTLTVTIDAANLSNDLSGNYKIPPTMSVEVSGLETVAVEDAFGLIDFKAIGISGIGKAYLDFSRLNDAYGGSLPSVTGNEKSKYAVIEPSENLKNGDTVTVTLTDQFVQSFSSRSGKVPISTVQTYTVSGLTEMVSTSNGLTDDQLSTLKSATDDKVQRRFSMNGFTINSSEYLGYCFMINNDPDALSKYVDISEGGIPYVGYKEGSYNYLAFIYKVNVNFYDTQNIPAYEIFTFSDVSFDAGGKVQALSPESSQSSGRFMYQDEAGVDGYASASDAQAFLDSLGEGFTVESHVDLSTQ